MHSNSKENIFSRLKQIFYEFSNARRIDPDSQMCLLWQDPNVEILVGSEELDALEIEFGIEFDDETALDIYNMELYEAAEYISKMIEKQNKNSHNTNDIINEMSPEIAKKVLCQVWKDSYKARTYITLALEKIVYDNE